MVVGMVVDEDEDDSDDFEAVAQAEAAVFLSWAMS